MLSIVIPLGPGETAWRHVLADLHGLQAIGCAHELVLVTAESNLPRPIMPSGSAALLWLQAEPGRASQQNAGAQAAQGDWLCFLHADSRLPAKSLQALAELSLRPPALYHFDLEFASDGPRLTALNAWGANLRSRLFGLPFGDQGLCLPRAEFERLGGFDTRLDRAEDHALVWRAHHAGLPVRSLRAPIRTSARRYAEHGWLRTTWRFLKLSAQQVRAFSRGDKT